MQFHDEHDDLDALVVAEMLLDGTLPFALIHYRGEPAGQTTISLPTERSLGHVHEVILSILQEFGLGQSSLSWMRHGMDTPY